MESTALGLEHLLETHKNAFPFGIRIDRCQMSVAISIATVSECSEWAEPIPELVVLFRSLRQNIECVLIELATSDQAVQAGLKAIAALRDYIQLSND